VLTFIAKLAATNHSWHCNESTIRRWYCTWSTFEQIKDLKEQLVRSDSE